MIRRYHPIFYNIIPRFNITTNLTILSAVKNVNTNINSMTERNDL